MIRGGSYQAVLSLGDQLFEELELLVTYCDQGTPECQKVSFWNQTYSENYKKEKHYKFRDFNFMAAPDCDFVDGAITERVIEDNQVTSSMRESAEVTEDYISTVNTNYTNFAFNFSGLSQFGSNNREWIVDEKFLLV